MKRRDEHEQEEHRDVAELLGKLPRKKAPAGFEARLTRRINSAEFDRHSEPRRAKNILTSSRFLPLGAGAAIVAIIAILVAPGKDDLQAEQLILEPEQVERLIEVEMNEDVGDAGSEKRVAEERDETDARAKKVAPKPSPELRAEMEVSKEAPAPPSMPAVGDDFADAEESADYEEIERDRSDDQFGGTGATNRRAAIPERNVYESQKRKEVNFIRSYAPPEEERRRIDSLRSRVVERLDTTGR